MGRMDNLRKGFFSDQHTNMEQWIKPPYAMEVRSVMSGAIWVNTLMHLSLNQPKANGVGKGLGRSRDPYAATISSGGLFRVFSFCPAVLCIVGRRTRT